jgi:ABC-type uncharacterized transport system involved in gliding motility auxiliary subunit
MKSKGIQTILYSSVGVAAMALILVAVNIITGAAKVRVDLTEEQAFTLSEGTRTILGKLESPVKIRFYCTQPDTATRETMFLRNHARLVEDLLEEFRQAGGGKVIIEKYNPAPDSDAEDSARLDGIEGQLLPNGERFYLGLTVSQLDQREVIPMLSPTRERQLEYDIIRKIALVANPERPVVGIMSGLPIWGTPSNPMMMQMGQRGSDPWVLVNELRSDFNVRQLELTSTEIADDIKLLVLIHPKEITEATQFAIDQFLMRGGRLIAFLDAYSILDSRGQQNPMMGMSGGGSSTLDKLLPAWGLGFETGKVVADINLRMTLNGRNGQPMEQPTWLSVTASGMNAEDVTTAEIDNVWIPMTGALTGTPVEWLKQTVLLKSTRDSQLVDGFMASLSGESVMRDFKSSDKEQTLALRLEGKFKTAFPNGNPGEAGEGETNAPPATLKESATETAVILVGDADMLADDFSMRIMNSPFGRLAMPLNANLNFAQNCVEQMAGDQNLIAVRSRATLNRPFEVVKEMQAEAERRFQGEIKRLEESAQQAQQRVNELQAQKTDGSQRFILSPEQEAELLKLQREEAETRRNLRQVQKDLRKEIVRLQNTIKWINILTVPLLVTAFGIGLAVIKTRKTGAR